MSAALFHRCTLRVPAEHPTLPGHFPGQPIAPGVLLLDMVIEAAERWLARPLHVRSLAQVKFMTPLPPEQEVALELTWREEELRFSLLRDDAPLAQGVFKIAR